MNNQCIDQITAALKILDDSNSRFLDQLYTMVHLHIDRKAVAMPQQKKEQR